MVPVFYEFPPFAWENQLLLKQLPNLILADQGSHQFDLVRFFMGQARSVYAQHLRVREDIPGEQVASTILQMEDAIAQVDLTFFTKTETSGFQKPPSHWKAPKKLLNYEPIFGFI